MLTFLQFFKNTHTQCSLLFTHSFSVAFSRKHNENSSGLQLPQVTTLDDLLQWSKTQVPIQVPGELFQPQPPHKSEEINHITLKLFSVRYTIIQASLPTFCSALHPHHTPTEADWASCHAADMSRHATLILTHTGQGSMCDANMSRFYTVYGCKQSYMKANSWLSHMVCYCLH